MYNCFFFFLKKYTFVYLFIYLFMTVLSLRFCARAFSSCAKWGPLFIAVRGPLTIAASLVAEHRLQTRSSVIVAHRPSCSVACGIFPDQGSNPCPLHWQADSQPLRHQGSPSWKLFYSRNVKTLLMLIDLSICPLYLVELWAMNLMLFNDVPFCICPTWL